MTRLLVSDARGQGTCDRCGAKLAPARGDEPRFVRRWCGSSCADAATASEPGWVAVADMTSEQGAELERRLGLSRPARARA
jgi:hypothetical protein